MSVGITLVGGPGDGRDIMLPDAIPPHSYRIPVAPPPESFLRPYDDNPFDCLGPTVANYAPLLVDGWPSLTDDGRYRYRYCGDDAPIHPGQLRPAYTLDELAALRGDPPRTAFPNHTAWLLGCRIRYSLHRDGKLTEAEQAVVRAVTVEAVRAELRKSEGAP